VCEEGLAVIEVEDSGIGIPADQVESIFDKFHQVGDTLTAKPQGTGLGLPISREIVHRHGGELTVGACPGGGSRFRAALPLASADETHPAPEPQTPAINAATSGADRSRDGSVATDVRIA
jgi:signal transduction histidine kinase